MSDLHDRVERWDAAYVMGALSPADRSLFEEHLAACTRCRDAVADLAPTAGLLSRLAPERARALDASPGPADTVRARVAAGARRRRRRAWALAAAAAIVAGAAVAVPVTIAATAPREGAVHALEDVAGAPLEASVRLVSAEWGTRIDLVCNYSGEVLDAPEGGWPYALAVVADDGGITTLSTWRAAPGSETRLSAGTDLAVAEIGAVEIRTIDGADVIMRYDAAG